MNGFIPLISSLSREEMMHLNTFLLIIDFLLLPLFGLMANRYSREKMMMLAGAIALISGFPLFWFLAGTSLVGIIFIRLALVIIGVWFSAPFHAWAQSLVPPNYRYTVISLGYALGSQILGGPTASISLWLFQKTHWFASVGWYWMILGGLACYFVAKQQAFVEETLLAEQNIQT
jgi:MFS family permease